jgi:hypothetical protein
MSRKYSPCEVLGTSWEHAFPHLYWQVTEAREDAPSWLTNSARGFKLTVAPDSNVDNSGTVEVVSETKGTCV